MPTLTINFDRLRQRLMDLGRIGLREDGGLYRMSFTDDDCQGRDWLLGEMRDIGLEPVIDGAANIGARLDGAPDVGDSVIVGSHIDTVPCGGTLDGALGVLAGLECLQVLKERNIAIQHPVEVISFTDEEGRFGGMLGSQAFTGKLTPDTIHQARDIDGISLLEAMRSHGYDPMGVLTAARRADTIHAFVELHIEQGPVLDRKGITLGLVEGIAGLFRWTVRFTGVANHSGTTPMDMRIDAFQGLAELAREIQRVLDENGSPQSVCNIGHVDVRPGASNVVPGLVEFTLEVRDPEAQILGDLAYAFRRTMSAIARRRELMFDFDVVSELAPVKCDRAILRLLERTATDLDYTFERLPSGAAHDTQNLATLAPSALIFVPSKAGKSHSPAEWTDWEDIRAGANLLLNTVHRLAAHEA